MVMGKHNLLNGHRGEDGAAVMPPFQPLDVSRLMPPPRGPVSTLQRHDDGHPAAAEAGRMSVDSTPRKSIDGAKARRGAMWALASGVAAIAAIVSYSHIYDLGRAHGGSGIAARLLPLSVDMLILVGELMLLHEADKKGRRFALGWVLVWSGILATLAANVTYGYQFGILGAVIWGWPAYSFILAAGGMVAVVKRGAVRDSAPAITPDGAAPGAPAREVDNDMDKPLDKAAAREVDKTPVRAQPKAPRRAATPADTAALDKAADVLRGNPGITNAAAARLAKVSAKTVQRARPLATAPRE